MRVNHFGETNHTPNLHKRYDMKICGACEKELPRDSFSGKQWKLKKSVRRCKGCVTTGKELVLFTKGRERSADDECPICSRLLPIDDHRWGISTCCMKIACSGCIVAFAERGTFDGKCLFCRTSLAGGEEAQLARVLDRVKVNDPMGIHTLAVCYRDGRHGLAKDLPKAVELFERAAKLGLKGAHFDLGVMFSQYNQTSSMVRALEHYEIAAKQGHVGARHNLGAYEVKSGNYGLALKHWMISAKLGHAGSLFNVRTMYTDGLALKADYAEAMHGYHDSVIEMSSPERDLAEARRHDRGECACSLTLECKYS